MLGRKISLLTAGAACLQAATAQFVTAPTDLTEATGYAGIKLRYKEVPTGICELDPNVKSYSGYADVSEGQHIFWWFFEARNQNASEAPLTVWINGGPGSSSMIGLFQENGPCRIDINYEVSSNPYSWNNVSNMLFIDQPTQTGFSYTEALPMYTDPLTGYQVVLPDNTCPDYASDSCATYSYYNLSLTANTTDAAAPNLWKTLQGFMGVFPQYSREDFFFTTESYGGHYGPVFNEYIETQNAANIEGAHNISLKGVLIGNGWFDPIIQYASYYNFTVYPGNTYNYSPYNQTIQDYVYNSMYGPGNCYDMLIDCNVNGIDEICNYADNFCYEQVEYAFDEYTGRDEYDIRELTPDAFPPEFYVDYLNFPEVQAAIGAFVNFTESSNPVYAAFESTGDDARIESTVEDVAKLLAANITVVMYHGDADYVCNWIGGEAVAFEIGAAGFDKAGYVNLTTSDDVVHGQVRQSGIFSFVRIFYSGHEVPFYQPLAALEMFSRALNGSDIATGLVAVEPGSTYATNGTQKSTYVNGNATIQTSVVPVNATYNTTLNGPNPPGGDKRATKKSKKAKSAARRWQKSRKLDEL